MGQREAYPYDEAYQRKILAVLCRDPVFMPTYRNVLNANLFENGRMLTIARLLFDFYDRTEPHVLPTRESLVEEFSSFCSRFNVPGDERDPVLQELDSLWAVDIIDAQVVKEKAVDFAARQCWRMDLKTLIDIIRDPTGDLEAIKPLVLNAMQYGVPQTRRSLSLFKDLESLAGRIRDNSASSYRVPTGLPLLDKYLDGGIGVGEVMTILGLPGGGKSALSSVIGGNGVRQGVYVHHFTIGDLNEYDTGLRYLSNLTRLPMRDVLKETPQYLERIALLKGRRGVKDLEIEYYSPGKIDMSGIRTKVIQKAEEVGKNPGLIIIDYPEKLGGAKLGDGSYESLKDMYNMLKNLADDFGSAVLAPSQVQRGDLKRETDLLRMNNIDASWAKAHIADIIVSMNQTTDEYNEKKARLWVDKVRRGESFKLIHLLCNFGSVQISEDPNPPPPKKKRKKS